jgi:LysR family transcriptional regulator for bpeEF and oprC
MKRLEEAECEIACMLGRPAGRLRVGMPVGLSRAVVTPALPRFLEQYPEMQVQVVTNDRIVDLIEEGIDVVLRVGELPDSSLQARKIGMLDIVTVASPAFLAKHGVPQSPDDLDPAHCLGLLNMNTGQLRVWEFEKNGLQRSIEPTSRLSFNDSESLMSAAIAGVGYARSLRGVVDEVVASGAVQEVLTDWHQGSRPISAVYARDRNPLAKVKVFIDFAAELFQPVKRPALKVVAGTETREPQRPARRATGASAASQPAPRAL